MDKPQNSTSEDYQEYTKIAFLRRGSIINEAILLERQIDTYISKHFCKDEEKQKELMELIICTDRITFSSKHQVLKVLLEKYNPEFLKVNENILKDITTIIEHRNIFAHYWLVTSDEMVKWAAEGKTVFIRFKNTIDYIEYDKDKMAEIFNKITRAIKLFIALAN
jgi:tRNA G18 (ribose-2'-O)-methylase SpoU